MLKPDDLINKVKSYNRFLNPETLSKAYDFALKAHEKQKRDEGSPYIIHPVAVANILTELKLDSATIATGLLHDTIEDTHATYKTIEKEFGKEINSTEIVPNIEQAIGLENALSILEKKQRVVASLVASEDMSVSLKSPRNKTSKILNYVRERFHVVCCAADIVSIDMPYTWADDEGVKTQTELARDIGMLSKSTVNASHCDIINNIFFDLNKFLRSSIISSISFSRSYFFKIIG